MLNHLPVSQAICSLELKDLYRYFLWGYVRGTLRGSVTFDVYTYIHYLHTSLIQVFQGGHFSYMRHVSSRALCQTKDFGEIKG